MAYYITNKLAGPTPFKMDITYIMATPERFTMDITNKLAPF